ncbi:hypothetical protein E3Q05_01019 [Wallemia mellicola]|nr:hypothetical protein E3Q05_01019 [Wallemia mellicola]
MQIDTQWKDAEMRSFEPPPSPPVSLNEQISKKSSSDYLHPSSAAKSSNIKQKSLNSLVSTQPQSSQQPAISATPNVDDDIAFRQAQLKQERAEKARAVQQAHEQQESQAIRKRQSSDQPLVGNLIGEDHANYVLMYNMLTGIRIGVSRCQAKLRRPLTDADFKAKHKFSFDIVGNELTPSAKYDFKFKDYAPWVFRSLRDDYFHLDPADYLLSLTAKYILTELGSPGKSGSFFYFSRDFKYIIKTVSHTEHKFLLSILKDYYEHVKSNPHTLLSRFYGLHRVKLPRGRKIHFVIMNNLFPPHRDIHETYDLKGSAIGREYPEEMIKEKPGAVLKDLNWVHRHRRLELGPEKRALFLTQLNRDTQLLQRLGIMDYSLLLGIHDMTRGNSEGRRKDTLKVYQPQLEGSVPEDQPLNTGSTSIQRRVSSAIHRGESRNVRMSIRRTEPKNLDKDPSRALNNADIAERRHFWFYQDEGGYRATDDQNDDLDIIYYLGVIDICTPYNLVKRIEHRWKSLTHDTQMISAIPAQQYGERFIQFMKSTTEHKATNGKIYWHNRVTKASSWVKPNEIKTRFDHAVDASEWGLNTVNDKIYWYNKTTKQSRWDMPEDLAQLKATFDAEDKAEAERKEAERIAEEKRIEEENRIAEEQRKKEELKASAQSPMLQIGYNGSQSGTPMLEGTGTPLTIGGPAAAPGLAAEVTPYEAKLALMDLFKQKGVAPDWTWEATIRELITSPVWKLEPSLSLKKDYFSEYIRKVVEDERAEKARRMDKLRPQFRDMLARTGRVHPYTKWSTLRAVIMTDPKLLKERSWQNCRDDNERKMLFDEYLKHIQKKEEDDERELRKNNIDKIMKYIETNKVAMDTKWPEFKRDLKSSREWRDDPDLQRVDMLDVLNIYEDNLVMAEKAWEARKKKMKTERKRDQRRKREAFTGLLKDLVKDGKIKHNTKWNDIIVDIKDDPRLFQIAGNSGSTALELFWDTVDEFQIHAEIVGQRVEDAFSMSNTKLSEEVSLNEFKQMVESNNVEIDWEGWSIEDIHNVITQKYLSQKREEKHQSERKRRIMIDDLRSAMRYLEPSLTVEDKFEDVLPRLKDLPEGKWLKDDDEACKIAFERRRRDRRESVSQRERERERDERRAERRRSKSPHEEQREAKKPRKEEVEEGEMQG